MGAHCGGRACLICSFCFTLIISFLQYTEHMERKCNMNRLVIDTDPGVDDAQAIMMAFAHPEAQVERSFSKWIFTNFSK